MPPIKILIADDHPILREGLRHALDLEEGFQVVGEVGDGERAVRETIRLEPDVVLMDISMPGLNGIEATELVKKHRPETGIVVLTIHEEEQYLLAAMKAGASCYVTKDAEPATLRAAIRAAAAGRSYVDPDVAGRLLGEYAAKHARDDRGSAPASVLTRRELEVLRLIAEGKSNREIAKELFISEKTVKNHVHNIYRKLGVDDRLQAALYAIRRGLVEIHPDTDLLR